MDGIEEPHEINVYLTSTVEKVKDPLMWWWDHRKVYPNLSTMALDYLSAPGEYNLGSRMLLVTDLVVSDINIG
jgi:hypothetical protein